MPTRSRALPPFPAPPPTVSRFDHPPTVAGGALYWREALARERARGDRGAVRTAEAIVASYEAARRDLRAGDLADF
jgi:hypothetical protein